MKLILRCTVFNILILIVVSVFSNSLYAQSKFAPTAVRVGTDVYGIGRTIFGEDRQKFELNGDLALDKYFLVLDLGIDNLQLDNRVINAESDNEQAFSYENDGYYFKLGADVNFMEDDPNNNVIFFGVRYARSFFSDKLIWQGKSNVFELPPVESGNENVRGRWFELAAGMKVNLWKELFVGYTVKYKFFRKINNEGFLTPYEMPGYGVYEKENRVAFHYQISWRFPFKKQISLQDQIEKGVPE